VDRGRLVDPGGAADLLRRPAVVVFLVSAFGVSLTTPFVYQVVPPYLTTLGLPRSRVAMAMSLGQILEVSMLTVLPWLMRRLGQRWTLTVGIAAWVVSYAIMAARPPLWVALLGIPLNGVAIALFHIAGPMFLDGQAPPSRRASVQCLYIVITAGVGSLLGNLLAGELVSQAGGIGASVFLVPCVVNLGLLAIFAWYFHPEATPAVREPESGSRSAYGLARSPLVQAPGPPARSAGGWIGGEARARES
jgi:MFS family permease